MKRPYDEVIDLYSKNLDRVRENQLRNFENSEKFMVWIVSFAVGGLSLIVSNLITLQNRYPNIVIKIVLVSLTISIIAGIVYRLAFYSFQIQCQRTEYYLKFAFSHREFMSVNPLDLSTETDYRLIEFLVKSHFGITLVYTSEDYENASIEDKELLLNNARQYYKDLGELAVSDFQSAIKYVDDIEKKAFGISDKKYEKIKNQNTARLLKIYGYITTIGFLVSCLSFIFVIILLTALY